MLRGVGGRSCEAPSYPDMWHVCNPVFSHFSIYRQTIVGELMSEIHGVLDNIRLLVNGYRVTERFKIRLNAKAGVIRCK